MFMNKIVFSQTKPTSSRFLPKTMVHKLKGLSVVLLSTLVFSVSASASESLTLSEAIHRTFASNPELKPFIHKLEAQQGKIVQAELPSKIDVGVEVEDVMGTGSVSGISNAQTTLSIGWVLNSDLRQKRVDVASYETKLIESEREIARLDVASQTARYFIAALSHQERILIADRAFILSQTTASEIKKRVGAGKAPEAELLRAEADIAKRRLVLIDLKYAQRSAFHQLAAQWGSTEPDFQTVSGALSSLPEIITFKALKEQLGNNPDLIKYLSLERLAEAELKLAEEERNPLWRFSAGLRRFEGSDDSGLVAGFSLPLNGRNRNQGRIAEVAAIIDRHQSEASAERIRAQTALFIYYQQLQRDIQICNTLRTDVIPRLEMALIETNKAYESGRYSYLELISVQNELLAAQSSLLDASLLSHLNKIEIERLTGVRLNTLKRAEQ